MNYGRTSKEPQDRHRVVVDFLEWLDPGEAVSEVSTPTVSVAESVWDQTVPVPPLPDPTPLEVFSVSMLDANTKVEFLLDAGTPNLVYTVTCLATGSTSGRIQTVAFAVELQDTP